MSNLWCCHVIGPDDVFAAPDYETAKRWAENLNEIAGPKAKELDVLYHAIAASWPWSDAEHADALPKSVADMEPRYSGHGFE